MKAKVLMLAFAGLLLFGGLPILPGAATGVAQAQSTTDRLLDLRERLVTQYSLYTRAHDTNRYTARVNGRDFNASTRVARDDDFRSHDQRARDAYNRASAAYSRRDVWTCEIELGVFRQEIQKMNSIGWYKTMHKMRTSSDLDVQQKAYDAGYRDNRSWEAWHARFALPRTRVDRLYAPDLNGTGGGANFGPAPDFNDPWW